MSSMPVDWAGIMLGLFYVFIVGTGMQQTYRAYLSRNRFISIRNSIVLLLTLSAFLRVILWIKVCVPGSLNDTFMLLMFFLPLWLNFAGLCLLAVFYTEAVYGGKTPWPMRIYFVFNLVLLVLDVTIATGTAKYVDEANDDDGSFRFSTFSIIYSSTLDFLLAALLCYYGIQFQILCNETGNALTTWTPNSVTIFESINWMLIVIYIFRGIAAAAISRHPEVMGQVEFNGDHDPTRATVLIFFFVTEILPSLCVMLMLWRVGGSTSKYKTSDRTTGYDDVGGNRLNTRLLSIEDSKVRILVGNESRLSENEVTNVFGEVVGDNEPEFLLFASNSKFGAGSDANKLQAEYGETSNLLHDPEAGMSPVDGSDHLPASPAGRAAAVAAGDTPVDYSKYSISAESSFLDDNKGIFVNDESQDNAVAKLGRKSSPVVIEPGKPGASATGLATSQTGTSLPIVLAGSLTDSVPRVGFQKRGSWSRANQFVSKRTPSPMPDNGQDDESVAGSSTPSGMTNTGSFQGHSGGFILGTGGGSQLNLAGMIAVPERGGNSSGDAREIISPAGSGSGSGSGLNAAQAAEKLAQAEREKYADTLSPMDILRQSQQSDSSKRKKKAHK